MRRVAALVVLVAACGGSAGTTSTVADNPLTRAAGDFAISADRALDGTRFAETPPATVAALLVELCSATTPLITDVARSVASVVAPEGDGGDDAILTEVLVAGVAEVCPQRMAADLSAAYLASVSFTIDQGSGVAVDDDLAMTTGLSVCAVLDAGDPGDALVTIAAALFGVEATLDELLAGAIDDAQGITAGAVLASAVTYLCPEHADRVEAFINEFGD